jgi:phage shock protein PspC (stress-responsive transcriptional regulator)
MTSPTSEGQRSGLDAFFSAVRGIGIRRRTDTKWVGGVCSGIADRFRIDPVVVRALLVVLILFGGFGVAAYLIAWALLPDAHDRIAAERALREGHAGSIVLLVIAAIALLGLLPWSFGHGGDGGFPWGLFVIGAVVWFVVHRSRSGRPVLHPRSQAVPPAAGAEAGPGEGSQEPAGPGQASSWGREAGEQVSARSQQVGEQAGTWGQQVGRQAAVRRRERRPSGGLLMTLVGIGLAMVAYGGTLWVGGSLGFHGDHHVIALAAALAALGLLVLGLGVAGWRAGFLGFVAVCTAVATLGAGAAPEGVRVGGRMGDVAWTPTVSDLGSGRSYDVGVGTGRLDLRDLPDDVPGHPTIPANVGIGQLTVLVPAGLTVALDGHVGAGEISVQDSTGTQVRNGTDVQQNATVGSEPADVTLDANVGVGQITVVKE